MFGTYHKTGPSLGDDCKEESMIGVVYIQRLVRKPLPPKVNVPKVHLIGQHIICFKFMIACESGCR